MVSVRSSWPSWYKASHEGCLMQQQKRSLLLWLTSLIPQRSAVAVQSNFARGRIAILSPLATARYVQAMRPITVFVRSWSHLTHGSLDPHESTPKRHLNWFSHFFQSLPVCPTHRQTRRPCYVRAMRPITFLPSVLIIFWQVRDMKYMGQLLMGLHSTRILSGRCTAPPRVQSDICLTDLQRDDSRLAESRQRILGSTRGSERRSGCWTVGALGCQHGSSK